MATVTLEELNKVNILTDRIRAGIERIREADIYVSPARGQLYTESWRETEGEPIPLRKAKAFQRVLEGIPVAIMDRELIAGSVTERVRGCFTTPEWDPDVFIRECQVETLTWEEDYLKAKVVDEQRRQILEDAYYWKGKSAIEQIWKTVDDLLGDGPRKTLQEARLWQNPYSTTPLGCILDAEKLLNKGLKGIIAEIQERLNNHADLTKEGIHRLHQWQAMVITCEAVIGFARRYADLARKLAEDEPDQTRILELERIADNCEWVPANPARNFYEALQSYWLVLVAALVETANGAKSPGRFDQYMYPFYAKDIESGEITHQEAAELAASFWVKLNEMMTFREHTVREIAQSPVLQNLTIGGVTRDGKDATNELSFLILEVERQLKLPQPQLTLRYHDGLPEAFLIKAVETTKDIAGKPAFFNDKVAILGHCNLGIPLEDARDWAPIGCVERYVQGCTGAFRRPLLNLTKILEITLNNGIDPRSGKQVLPATGDPREFSSFEDLYNAFKKQAAYVIELVCKAWRVAQIVRGEVYPLPFESALLGDCVENGLDCMEGGLRYNQPLSGVDMYGHVNPANSLAAVKKLVFEEQTITMDELLEALAINFEGKEKLRALLLAAPKYGNDDDYVDEIMKDIYYWTEEMVKSQVSAFGHPYVITRKGLTTHFSFGKVIGALPDGRKAWEPLADGSLSPMRGTDVKGPTAVINSASKPDQVGSESTLLNQKLYRSIVDSKDGIRKLLSLIKTYFDNYGYHIQFNIFDPQTLIEAKKHPEEYRSLVVRVAGFSAYFVELSAQVQDEIIARTTQTL
ncbi:glycyl radical protein [Chloroflexota bacterium]